MKILTRLTIGVLLAAAAAAVWAFLPFSLPRMPWSPRRITTVYTTLIESTEISLLQTAEYSLKILFPYDFIDEGDDINWRRLQRRYNLSPEEFRLLESPEFHPDFRIPPEWKYASLYRICRESGLDPASDPWTFVVIEAGLKAGITLPEFPLGGGGAGAAGTMIRLEGPEEKKVVLTLPAPEITDIIIRDRPAEGHGYPDVRISPRQWGNLITLLTPRIENLAREEGILEEASSGAEALLTDLFEGAGFEISEIRFNS